MTAGRRSRNDTAGGRGWETDQIAWHPPPNKGMVGFVPGTRRGRAAGGEPAAEGATGPRKRSGKKDRDGQGSLESRAARERGVRTDGVRGYSPESLRYRDRGGSSPPASRRRMALSRRP